jgi:hypothetical protein
MSFATAYGSLVGTGAGGLHGKMRALASKGHPRADELRAKADEFETKAKGFYATPQACDVKSFMGAWARARKLFSDCSGEPLI